MGRLVTLSGARRRILVQLVVWLSLKLTTGRNILALLVGRLVMDAPRIVLVSLSLVGW